MHTADTETPLARIEDTLRNAATLLSTHSDSPRLDAELLMAKVLGISRAGLIARAAQPMQPREISAFESLLSRRLAGSPVAYLIEMREFWSMNLRVTPAVLVPRPDTEILVEQALEMASRQSVRSLLDLGTGSGAIALAIASERPDWQVTGVDVSQEALWVAMANSSALQIANIQWKLGSWFDAVPGERFDLIVGNPPYIAADDPALQALLAEPRLALTPGATGLEALQWIIARAPKHLVAGGSLLLEHGHDQSFAVQRLLLTHGFEAIRSCLDLAGKARITLGTLYTTSGNL